MTCSATEPRSLRYARRTLAVLSTVALLGIPAAAWPAQEGAEGAFAATTNAASQITVAVIIIAVFVLLTLEAAHRVLVVLAGASLLWAITYLTPLKLISFEATARAVDLNVLVLLASMMALVGVLKSTGLFAWAVARIMHRAGGRPIVLLRLVVWMTAILSAFLDNVTTVVFVTPMVIGVAKQLQMRPAVFLLPVVMAANIGGTATLIGDPPNIMIGSGAHLTFLQFIQNLTVPCVLMMFWLEWYAARYYATDIASARPGAAPSDAGAVPAIENPALLRWMVVIGGGVLVGFVTHGFTGMPAAVPATIGAAAALVVQDILYVRRHRPTESERRHGLLEIIEREIEWPTLSFFGFLFIIVGAAVATGLIATVANSLSWAIGAGSGALGLSPTATLLGAALLILWVSGALSAMIDNIPFVAVMIPIIAQLRGELTGDTAVLWWALSLGACLGGNGTPVGASANVTVIGFAERAGARVTFAQFARFGIVVATGTLLISTAFLVLYVYAGSAGAFWWGLGAVGVIASVRALRRRAIARGGRELGAIAPGGAGPSPPRLPATPPGQAPGTATKSGMAS